LDVECFNDKFYIDFSTFSASNYGTWYYSPNFNTFTYYKRYKEDGFKKIFLSSRYLEDAVINYVVEISCIKGEIGSVGSANNTKITNNDAESYKGRI